MTTPLNPGFDVSGLAAPYFFGGVISFVMVGITIVQGWTYMTQNRDSLRLRLFSNEHRGVMCHISASDIDANPQYLLTPSLPLGVELLFNTIIIVGIDFFLANQIRGIAQTHWTVPIFIVVTAIIGFGLIFSLTVATMVSVNIAEHFFTSRMGMAITSLGNACYTVAEVMATIALGWSLHKAKTGIRRTDSILTKLFTWMVTRGILLSIIQVLSMILYLVSPASFLWVPFHLIQSKIYVITTLSLLNSRKYLRRQINIFDSDYSNQLATDNPTTTPSGDRSDRPQLVDGSRSVPLVEIDISTNEDLQVQSAISDKDMESALTVPESPVTIVSSDFGQCQEVLEVQTSISEPVHHQILYLMRQSERFMDVKRGYYRKLL
ncbi:hypothetical protein K435DRAFT_834563 [Dendrothele bispora CBS 962.96]|uniref:DUF6534 domain-containing protein n=1 Tax=Dendrothele bispora (strain CBS 962.96) TaxID=1314807 RepID=A0A4S8MSF8_DENBC|nr:hypothetical protein K435DRAFT_834563 [Dendrothele bispora CBS 962.96]